MATFPLALPTSPGFGDIRWRPRAVVSMTASPFSLKQKIQEHQGDAWAVEIDLPPMVRADGEAWWSTFLLLNGRANTFLFGDPAGATARGSIPGAPVVDGGSQTGHTLNTKGWTASQSGVLLAGDWVQVGSGITQRAYKVRENANSDGGGLSALSIWPALRESPADSETLVVANCKATYRLGSNEMPFDVDTAEHYTTSFLAIEAI